MKQISNNSCQLNIALMHLQTYSYFFSWLISDFAFPPLKSKAGMLLSMRHNPLAARWPAAEKKKKNGLRSGKCNATIVLSGQRFSLIPGNI